ncbi:hypothetical protein CYMTET_22482 [Cymbomonas tetramitiformis]|uniref:Phytanoyl-CoA dioxygenase n=1 Tax=Cymbomonas tetramitiformis TaxID=36881 RepID=A0AAE0G0F0_9CHLO|nr:hypothetical protein CYMTET_22482 [Cymbomonas tetramitiformis]
MVKRKWGGEVPAPDLETQNARERLAKARESFRSRGYCILEGFLSPQHLELLRDDCDSTIEAAVRRARLEGSLQSSLSISSWLIQNHGCIFQVPTAGRSLETAGEYRKHRAEVLSDCDLVEGILFGTQLKQVVETLLGGSSFLFNEQYIVKPPHVEGTAFAWHRDSKWCDTADLEYSPYLSFWCALDDVGEENGTLYIKPYPICGTVPHSGVCTH